MLIVTKWLEISLIYLLRPLLCILSLTFYPVVGMGLITWRSSKLNSLDEEIMETERQI